MNEVLSTCRLVDDRWCIIKYFVYSVIVSRIMNQDSFAESHPLQKVNNRLSFNSYPCKDESNSRSLLRV